MKNLIQIIACLISYFWVVTVGWGQDKPRFILSTNPIDWQKDISNFQAEVFPLNRLSIVGYANHFNPTFQTASFTKNIEGYTLGGQLRYYILGQPRRLTVFSKNKSVNRWGCPSARNFQKKSNQGSHRLAGLFLSSGYEVQTSEQVFQSNAEVEVNDLIFKVYNNGVTLGLGYQIMVEYISFGFQYEVKFSQPKWEGPIDIFGDSLYSTTMPIPLRIENQFKLSIGLSF